MLLYMNFPQLINYLKRSRKEDVKDCIVVLYKTWENNETTKAVKPMCLKD